MNNINQINEKGIRQGYWERYWSNNILWHRGNYINGKKFGYWEWYYKNGELRYKEYYL